MPSIKEVVAEKLSQSSGAVKEAVVDLLVKEELGKRTDIVVKAISKLDALEKDIRKAEKPDIVSWEGSTKKESMSDSAYKKLQDLKLKHANLTDLFDKALSDKPEIATNDVFKKLSDFNYSSPDKGGSKPEAGTQSSD